MINAMKICSPTFMMIKADFGEPIIYGAILLQTPQFYWVSRNALPCGEAPSQGCGNGTVAPSGLASFACGAQCVPIWS